MLDRRLTRGTLACFLLLGVAAAQDPPATPPPSDLPAAKELAERTVEVMGGKESIEAVKSLTYRVTVAGIEEGDGTPQSMVVNCILPERVHLKGDFAGGQSAIMVYDGTHAWSTEPGDETYSLEDPAEATIALPLMAPQAFLLSAGRVYTKMETTEKVDRDGATCFAVRMTNESGSRTLTAYFNEETGLIDAIEIVMDAEMDVTAVTSFSEWKEIGGVRLPTKSTMELPFGESLRFQFEGFELNKADKSLFEIPAEVKKMIEEEKGAGGGDGGGGGGGG